LKVLSRPNDAFQNISAEMIVKSLTAVFFAVSRRCYLLKSTQKGAIMVSNAIAVTKAHATFLAYFQQSMRL
jgi:hypothetical protein